MKYSINGTGNIVAERDIYSLGGFIPKGTVGGKVASEKQLSQDGECWLAGGDISTRPDIVIKDNAYIGDFLGGVTGIHTDGITEFSGDTLIPGKIIVRSPIAGPLNNFFVKDTFIGVSMDVLCGPESTTTAFPFVQGGFNKDVPAGTLFTSASMHTSDANICRTTANLCLGKDTYLYFPIGYNCRVFWGYRNTAGQLAYSGESFAVPHNLIKLEHPTYRLAMVHIAKANGTAMTPTDLLATGAKVLGHINGSLLQDFRPESASGQYVMVNSSFLTNTDNFGLNTTQLRYLAGSMYDANVYTPDSSTDYKIYGTFHNVQCLEYTKYLGSSHRTNVNRDRYISAYDCPLLRVDDDTYDTSLMGTGDLVLRRCIVPKARFAHDPINGNTYEDLDFSYANEDLGFSLPGYAVFTSSHRKGMYRVKAGIDLTRGLVSYKGNLADSARLFQPEVYLPLDGSIMEQGAYGGGTQIPYESAKSDSPIRIRTGKPLATSGLTFPSLPAGYSVKALYYLDEDFVIRSTVTDPTELVTTYPYVVMLFRKDDDSAINVTDFIALNRTLETVDDTKVPEITGSAYVGAGCTVRGDVKLIGDPYVNRLLDVNMWERGTTGDTLGTWDDMTKGGPHPLRYRLVDTIPVEPGGSIECGEDYYIECNVFDINGRFLHRTGWTKSYKIPENGAFLGLVLRLVSDGLIVDSDIPLAKVKYLRSFKKRRYITNELDRVSPEDILLGPDYWEQGGISIAEGDAGKPYEELKIESPYRIRPKRLFGLGTGYRVTFSSVYSFGTNYYDAVTKLLYGSTSANMNNALFALVGSIAGSPTATITPADVTAARVVIEFTPTPRIIVPYGSATLTVNGMRIRMYDNAVLSRKLNQEGEIVLQGDAVMGYDFSSGDCLCSNGHDDAIIKLP